MHSVGLLLTVTVALATATDILQVPEPVMDFILGCDRNFRGPKLPVSRSTINEATGEVKTSYETMNLQHLKESLSKSLDDGAVVNHIVSEVEKTMTEQHREMQARQGCINVAIDTPPQVNENLSGQLQAVITQNNQLLLKQINTLFTFKLNQLLADIQISLGQTPTSPKVADPKPVQPEVPAKAVSSPVQESPKSVESPVQKENPSESVVPRDDTVVSPELLPDPQEEVPVQPGTSRDDLGPLKTEESPEDVPTVPLLRRPNRGQFRRNRNRNGPSRRAQAPVVQETAEDGGTADETPNEAPSGPSSRQRIRNMLLARRQRISQRN